MEMARYPHSGVGNGFFGIRDPAHVHRVGTTRMEPAAPRRREWARHVAAQHDAGASALRGGIGDGDGREQGFGVRVAGSRVHLLRRALLDHLATQLVKLLAEVEATPAPASAV